MSGRYLAVAVVMGGLLAIAAFAAMGGVTADEVQSEADEHITVTAGGEASAEPDAVVVSVGVEAEDDDPSTARSEVAETGDDILDALAAAGYSDDDVASAGFEVREQRPFEVPDDREPRHIARHEFEVSSDNPDDAGDIIDTAVDAGATVVSDVSFTLSDDKQDEMRQEALEDAMDNARTQAEAIEGADDITVTGVRSVSTEAASVSPVTRDAAVYQAAELDDAADTQIEIDDVDVSASVRVVYDAN